jgi:DNA-binding transcriptional LysR family regulator
MSLDNNPVNLRNGEFDIVILLTDTLDPGVIAKKITQTEICTYASLHYLKTNGYPNTIKDLSLHRCLLYTNTPHGHHWIFNVNGNI